jgi:uncharacterized protein (TIGR00266 family)
MNLKFEGEPSFTFVHVDLEPGESFVAESDAMASMDADLDMDAKFNGGFISGLLKKFLGGESLFVNVFTNRTSSTRRVTVTQPVPGGMMLKELNGESFCLQPGAYVCSTPGVKLGVKWAGFASLIAREGLFKLVVSGNGKVIFGSFGALIEKQVEGEYIVDSSHLVGYDPQIKLSIQLAGNIVSSVTSGEGFVTRVRGNGKIIMQSRSLSGMVRWVNPHLY